MDRYERNVVRLYQSNAFKINLAKPFVLTSGQLSPYYLQAGDIQNHPESYMGALEDFRDMILETVGIDDIERVSGGETRDWLFSIPLAVAYLQKPHVMIRKEESGHGTGGRLITTINPGERMIHVADLRTTGKSELEWIGIIREYGGKIDHSFSYIDRMQGGTEALSQLDPPVQGHSVVQLKDIEEFFKIGLRADQITQTEYEELMGYVADPKGWSARKYKTL